MKYSISDVVDFIRENDVKFVRLVFCDLFGRIKNVTVMADCIEEICEKGKVFTPTGIDGFGTEDLLLFPDLDTMNVLPWRPQQGRVIRFVCSVRTRGGQSFGGDGRAALERVLKEAADDGYRLKVGTESEFYLFCTDENGDPTYRPHDNGGYLDMAPLDKGENIRREICYNLEAMEIRPTASHHERGRGQHEIVFEENGALEACDDFIFFKSAVKVIAGQNGLYASFMPKPLLNEEGNGMNITVDLWKDGNNLFGESIAQKTPLFDAFAAGVLSELRGITAFLNTTVNSYERLGQFDAPERIGISEALSDCATRIVQGAGGVKLEVRSPDALLNPYFALALLIRAGLNGIRENRTAPLETEKLPVTLSEALEAARASKVVQEVIPCSETYFALQEAVISEAVRNVGAYREKLFSLA